MVQPSDIAADLTPSITSTSVSGSYNRDNGVCVYRKELCNAFIVYSLLCAGNVLQVALLASSCPQSASITEYSAWAEMGGNNPTLAGEDACFREVL